jgi:hypothetical protein
MANVESAVNAPVVESPVVESPKAPSKRQVELKAMRATLPAKLVSLSSTIESIDTAKVTRKAGSKAARCVAAYAVGLTVQQVIDANADADKSYAKACIIWDFQHSNITLVAPVAA